MVADWLWRVRKRKESMMPHRFSFSATEGRPSLKGEALEEEWVRCAPCHTIGLSAPVKFSLPLLFIPLPLIQPSSLSLGNITS